MKVAYYTDKDGCQLYGSGRWPTIGIMKGGGGTMPVWKVANYTDNESGQLYG